MAEKAKKTSQKKSKTTTPVGIGAILRKARLEKKLKLDDVAGAINIRKAQLKSIEAGAYHELPGQVYAIGFIRSYAEHVDLDGEEAVRVFKEEHTPEEEKLELNFPVPVEESKMPGPEILIMAGAGLVLVLILWAIFSYATSDETAEIPVVPDNILTSIEDLDIDPMLTMPLTVEEGGTATASLAASSADTATQVSEASQVAPTQTEGQPGPEQQTAPAVKKQEPKPRAARNNKRPPAKNVYGTKGKARVILRAVETSWVQISDSSEKVIFKKVLRVDDEYRVPNLKGITLVTANAGGLQIYVDGTKVQPIGKSGDIIRGVSLSPKDLGR